MHKRSWLGVIGFLACIVLVGGYLLSPGANGAADLANRHVGVVEGTEVDLAFKMGGSIKEVLVKEGDTVKAGQPIALLDSDELLAKRQQAQAAYQLALTKWEQAKKGVSVTDDASSAQIRQTQAAVEAARAQYEANKNGARPEEIAQLEAKLQAARTAKQVAQTSLDRVKKLYEEGAVAKTALEEAQMQFDKAQAELSAVEEQLKMAQSGSRREQLEAAKAQWEQAEAAYQQAVAGRGQVGLKQLDVQQAEAAVQQAKGALAEIDAYLNDTRLVAPVAGVVKSVAVQKGELVAQGFTVATIQAEGEHFVKFYLDENELGKLNVGQKATLYVPALGKEVEGTIAAIAPAADFAVKKATQELGDRDVRAFQVKLSLHDPQLRPGYSVEWRLEGADRRE
ncbi:HlyD family efflux transporter periplasmic adaptor subunit [Brevibacillus sp. SYP-B805]|uniref:HlyD family secretion protein n=1 Tax=Brevibacillus sp. SYP-B805 TaxID=1578199 RepID=UPI0013EBACF2|nr:HlyD family efflux transporter periplasmic adaptor subunit [Brevibacillus sp. SYP-B805]NGQ97088.1 HlyD family efflux transporter periplasmic adaptor subunit [Brevibacillus sp. SYP-B805]